MPRTRTKILAVLLLAASALSGGVVLILRRGSERSADGPSESMRRMAAELEGIAARFANAELAEANERLFRANRPAWIPLLYVRIQSARDPGEGLRLRYRLAGELLWAGRTEEALAKLQELDQAIRSSSLPPPAREELLAPIRDHVATAFLRLGEETNCIAAHSPESCLFPIEGGGIHRAAQGSRMAIRVLEEDLRKEPDDLGSRWLLNLAYMTLGEYPDKVPEPWRIPPETFASDADVGRFPNVAPARGAGVLGLAGGCAVEDFDRDGDLDIIASSWGLRDPLRYLVQEAGGGFADRTREAGLDGEVGGLNIVHADYDNDGFADVLVLRGGWMGADGAHPNSLLRNRGDGTFEDATEAAGLLSRHPTQTAAWGDYDNDGWLDLFIGNEDDGGLEHPSELFHNQGDGTFRECAAFSGLTALGFVKGVAWGDYDNDGFLDLYVSRIDASNSLFRNGGRAAGEGWAFEDVAVQAGVAEPVHSFPAWFFDADNDGWLDIFVAGFDGASIAEVAADYLGRPHSRGHPRLYLNRGDGTFRDATRAARLDRVLLVMGANYGDLDSDGFPDIYLGTGAPNLRTLMPNRMFRNAGGKVFQDVTTSGGFGHLQKGHGIAFADFDGDGDQDVYAVMGGWYTGDVFQNALFENPGHGNHWITLRLAGRRSNRSGIGARISVHVREAGGVRRIEATGGTGGSFGSSSLEQEIGLGRALAIESLEVRWPSSGRTDRWTDVAMDRVYVVEEGAAALRER